ncbi:MAG TPA: DUF4157 domain-containing protein [Acidimicrobiia bacterium]|nr:DUF4157 domain-containing protein [Acidimicrobiia bacterium]
MHLGQLLARADLGLAAVEVLTGMPGLADVAVRPAPRWLRRLWRGQVVAMTVKKRIYLAPELVEGDPARLGRLLVHELVHVRQWADAGALRFLRRYAVDYLVARVRGRSHTESYHGIRYEVEARRIAGG